MMKQKIKNTSLLKMLALVTLLTLTTACGKGEVFEPVKKSLQGESGEKGSDGADGADGNDGDSGDDGDSSALFLSATKKHSPSQFISDRRELVGYVIIPEKAYIVKGCGSNDGGVNKAAQLIIDDTIVCRYNPDSTVNKPCGTSQEELSKVYKLVSCDLGYDSGDIVAVDESVELSLTKADSSQEEVVLRMKVELN